MNLLSLKIKMVLPKKKWLVMVVWVIFFQFVYVLPLHAGFGDPSFMPTPLSGLPGSFRFSPDGNSILYVAEITTVPNLYDVTGIFTINADGTENQLVFSFPPDPNGFLITSVCCPARDISGEKILFLPGSIGGTRLYRVGRTGTDLEILACEKKEEEQICPNQHNLTFLYSLVVSDNGIFVIADNCRNAGPTASCNVNLEIWHMNHDGSNAKQLTNLGGRINDMDISPDGNFFVVEIERFDPEGLGHGLYLLNRDGNIIRKLAQGTNPRFSPDGQRITFQSIEGWVIINLDGTGLRKLEIAPDSQDPLQHPIIPHAPSFFPNYEKLMFVRSADFGIGFWYSFPIPDIVDITPVDGSTVYKSSASVCAKFVLEELGGVDVNAETIKLKIDEEIVQHSYLTGNRQVCFQPTFLENGLHKVELEALDLRGHKTSNKWSFTVLSDEISPTITELKPEDRSKIFTTLLPTISAKVFDNEGGSGIDSDSIKLFLNQQKVNHSFDGILVSFTPSDPLATGQHSVLLEVKDVAGNLAKTSWSFTVAVDQSEPTVAIVSPLPGSLINTRTPLIKATLSDEGGSGIKRDTIVLEVDGVVRAANFDEQTGSLTFTPSPQEALGNGEHTVKIQVADNVGNKAEQTWKFKVDATVPKFKIQVVPNPAKKGEVIIIVTPDEPLKEPPNVEVKDWEGKIIPFQQKP